MSPVVPDTIASMTSGSESASAAARAEDLKLAERCIRGDRTAQRELFERERKRVHATLYGIMGSNQGIDDVIQDTFFAVFRSLHQYRGEARLSTWIERCAVRMAYGYLKHGRRARTELIDDSVSSGSPTPERRMLIREAGLRLYEILDALAPKLRVAYVLHVLDERPLAEVAALTDATVVATKLRVWRARQFVERAARDDALLGEFQPPEEGMRKKESDA
jgi:RNA polymerase sigma factor (sigma-70 family)